MAGMEESAESLWEVIGERLEGVKKLISVSVEPAVGKYENYASDMKRLNLRILTSDDSEKTMSVVQKSKKAPIEGSYDFTEELGVFKTETLVYQDLLRPMEKLISEHWPNETPFWPKCLGLRKTDIFMEDLKALGYRLTPKHEALDLQHAILAIRSLAKFHALGLVLMEKKMFDPSKLRGNLYSENNEFLNNILKNGLAMLSEAIKTSWGPEWQDAAARVDKAKENLGEKLKKLSEESDGDFNVINHGDCWSNNMMFKYDEETQTPISIRFVDFQCCHFSSLSWDVSRVLATAVFPEVRMPNLGRLLDEYSEVLGAACRELGYKGQVPDKQEVHRLHGALGYYSFAFSVATLPLLMMSLQIDLNIDADKVIQGFHGFDDYFKKDYFDNERVVHNMKMDLNYAMELGVI